MKTKISAVLMLLFIFVGCTNDDLNSTNEQVKTDSSRKIDEFSHYYPMTCNLPDGSVGSKCGISQSEACLEGTSCKANSTRVNNYIQKAKVNKLIKNNSNITDPNIILMLKEDNILPLK